MKICLFINTRKNLYDLTTEKALKVISLKT